MLGIGIALVAGALVLNVISVRLRRRDGARPAAPTPDVSAIDDSTRSEIDELVADDNKIAAIKRLRTAVPGLGLAEAKARIDAWGTGPFQAVAGDSPATSDADPLDPASLAEIDALIADDQLIPAIKLVRERTGWGLADAKHWVDARSGR
jgi:ribosomal protein L7/L12